MSRLTAGDRLQRVLAVVPYIVANPGRTMAELADRFGVDEKALFGDLSVVFMVGLPPYSPDSLIDVEIDEEGRVSIRLADYFSRPLRLSPAEGLSLVAASDALLSVPGTDPDGALARALAKLARTMGVADRDLVDVHLGGAESHILAQLRQASSARLEVEMRYYSYGRDSVSHRTIDPWRVFADGGHWYLHAWCHQAEGERLFRVDRIDELTLTERQADSAPDSARGLSGAFKPGDDDPRVTLRLHPEAAWVAETYPCDEVVAGPDGTLDVTLAISQRPWLERLLLRLGPLATVVSHRDLPEASGLAAETARRVLARYGVDE